MQTFKTSTIHGYRFDSTFDSFTVYGKPDPYVTNHLPLEYHQFVYQNGTFSKIDQPIYSNSIGHDLTNMKISSLSYRAEQVISYNHTLHISESFEGAEWIE